MTYDLPDEIQIEVDGPVRVIRLNRPEQLNATNHVLHHGLAELWPQLDADTDARAAVLTGNGRAFSAGGDFGYLDLLATDADDTWLRVYLYSRAQSVMGGTSQIQRNLVATRILELPT